MDSPYLCKPEPFFKDYPNRIIIDSDDCLGLNVGYEASIWQYEAFSEYLFNWLIEFTTSFSDLREINQANCLRMIRKAANIVYSTDKYNNRGEFGELMLHAILRELFGTEPAISKLYYKSATNDTVKGFDAVHIRKNNNNNVELWLGEVKFYSDINRAISDVTKEIEDHLESSKLREEFMCVGSHIDLDWEFAPYVKKLLDRNTSLDNIFNIICIPVLLTYESTIVKNAHVVSDAFIQELRIEIQHYNQSFKQKLSTSKVKIHLVLLPLEDKQKLITKLDEKLKSLQK
ncbi:DUF1837 domain-containing protein [Candidatus Saccharibacteria bacterium]|nr:DUF1837 domain-containing protein [Candidatus Saccharibacteria bacterium]